MLVFVNKKRLEDLGTVTMTFMKSPMTRGLIAVKNCPNQHHSTLSKPLQKQLKFQHHVLKDLKYLKLYVQLWTTMRRECGEAC